MSLALGYSQQVLFALTYSEERLHVAVTQLRREIRGSARRRPD